MGMRRQIRKGAAALAAALIFMTAMPAQASDSSVAGTTTTTQTVATTTTTQGTSGTTTSTQTERTGVVSTNGGRLNLREGAGLSYKIIARLNNGTSVTVLGEENGWYKVSVNGMTGYVSGQYLKVTEKSTTTTTDTVVTPVTTVAPTATPTVAPTPTPTPAPLTPDGNLELVDDVTQSEESKQFLTVQSKNDNTFYLIIDHDRDEENVYFLNKVDESDLMALTEDGESTVAVCTCKTHCEAGSIDTTCEVCKTSMVDCTGTVLIKPTATPEPVAEPEPEEDNDKESSSPMLMVVLLIVLGVGGAIYYLKFRKGKSGSKTSVDMDDFDFSDDEDEDETEYVSEDEKPDEMDNGDE